MTPQKKATVVSSSVAAILTLMKLVIGIASGSVAVLASAIDSVLDMFVSLFNYFAVNNSEKPADETFNYGRGKIEALASVIEGTIITISGLFLLYQAIEKAINGEVSQYLGISLGVMVASLIITVSLVIYLNKIAKQTNSMVIKADALHYKTDVYTNAAVLVSLLLVNFTGIELIDVIVGGGISIFIIYSAYELIQEGVLVLLDRAVDEEIVKDIKKALMSEERVNTYHMLKTREAGNQIFVDVHLVYDCLITLMEAHKITDKIENKIRKLDRSKDWVINIHMDPYDDLDSNEDNHLLEGAH
ncbi:cation diffusion facilitator family transporter [Arcobacter arenosus]|jgi:cation diffusion facilitator family transporter|uniref:Cation transporter n=1 Tax=Arcobacter arenosus TaxID=2576037 RepID=A0A5R8Y0L6_9BACT|nr:cation diffusion facilitator family transporter [Arcobacter arenosus]TLP37613.1 cation transporter [Arcobacter arenosus]